MRRELPFWPAGDNIVSNNGIVLVIPLSVASDRQYGLVDETSFNYFAEYTRQNGQ